ncbi:MAG TPA: hypothetical protein VL002_00940 [Candidimonas sp.]|nr:hypothetical protein [Candidimonas sp.]
MLKALEIFFAQEKTKPIFDHLRNLLVCTLLLAAGSFQLKQPFGIFADSVFQSLLGYGVVAMAVILILLNLLDGIYKLSKIRHPFIFKLGLIVAYIIITIRVVVVTSLFRVS